MVVRNWCTDTILDNGSINIDENIVNYDTNTYTVSDLQEFELINIAIISIHQFGISEKSDIFSVMYNSNIGDINDNGLIDIVDIILMVNMIMNEEYSLPADMNADGIVNILDILALVNYILAE